MTSQIVVASLRAICFMTEVDAAVKSTRGRELSAEDIVHYGKVMSALGETIRIMKEVDEVIESAGGWPVK